MLRLIFVTSSLPHGGAERSSITLMNRLAERGHECHAIYIKESGGKLDRLRLRDGGTVRCLDAARYFDRRALADFAAHISRIRPSVIVAANPYALMYSSLALRRSGVRAPLVATFHATRLTTLKDRLKMLLDRPFFWAADCTVFVCEMQRRYWRYRGVFSRRNEVIYNGVDTDEFRDGWTREERGRLRAQLGFSEADFVIGMVAFLRPEKNHLQLIDAIAVLRARGIAAKALMIGDGEMRARIEARARERQVERDIVITGVQEDVRPYVAACDTVALCSFTEAFPLAAIEAMALRRPVVHSHVGGAAEMILPGWNGFLFPVGDTHAFAEKLATLSDRTMCSLLGARARQVVERLFSEKTMVDRYERLLMEVCGVDRRAREALVT